MKKTINLFAVSDNDLLIELMARAKCNSDLYTRINDMRHLIFRYFQALENKQEACKIEEAAKIELNEEFDKLRRGE